MRIALINPPNPDPPPAYYGPPYGLSLLAAVLERAGYPVKGLDFDRLQQREALAELPRLLREDSPDLVGISVLSSSRGSAFALAAEIKRLSPATTVVCGGPFATLMPRLAVDRGGADFVVVGDGEETLLELVEALERGGPVAAVRGLAYRADGSLRQSAARAPFSALDSLPYPAFHLFDASARLESHRRPGARALAGPVTAAGRRCLSMRSALMVLGSRGCVFRCAFCPMSRNRAGVRRHSPGYFLGLLEHLSRTYRQRDFVFGDNFFTLDRDWVREVCAGIVSRKLAIEWICMTRPDAVDRRLLGDMARAGCREISYGVESGSARIQGLIGKRIRLGDVAPAFAATRQAGISSVLMLMVGNPGESRRTISETAAFTRALEPDRVLIHTAKVYPGTRLHDLASARGVIPPGFYESDDPQPPPYTAELSRDELEGLKALIQPRTAYLSVHAGCANGCCARRRPQRGALGPGLRQALALASLRAERVILGGGEPFLRKDLPEILETARLLEVHGLWLYTTARPMAGGEARGLLRPGDVMRGIVVPLFSPDPAEHDRVARVPGALLQTRLGLLRWRKSGGLVTAWAFLSRENVGRAAEWIRWLADHGVCEAVFLFRRSPPGWGDIPWKDLPGMAEAALALSRALPEAGRCGVGVSVFGIPECVLPDARVPHHDRRGLFDEEITASGEPVALPLHRRRALKARAAACRACRARDLCEGVWRGYLARRGEGEFHAL